MERRYAFFPYLKTSGTVRYRNVTFASTGNLAHVPHDVAQHITTLASMFFLRDDLRIRDMTYTVVEAENTDKLQPVLEALAEFQAMVRYLYSAPHAIFGNPFLTAEHGSLYAFRQRRVSKHLLWNEHHVESASNQSQYEEPDDRDEVAGYEGYLDQRSLLWVAKGSRIYPPARHMWLNISQNLYTDIEHRRQSSRHASLLRFLEDPRRDRELCDRILTAIRWYNRSVAMDVPDDMALVSLAIAFEALLRLPRGKQVTDRFKYAVTLLLGPVPRLDSFLTQFYDARSDIVHEGVSENLMFRATDSVREVDRTAASRYRSLASYARHIFQVCLLTIVQGGHMASVLSLDHMFTTNQQRYEEVCRVLSSDQQPAGKRLQVLRDLIRNIENYQFVPEEDLQLKTLIAACRLAASDYLETSPTIPTAVDETLRALSAVQSDTDPFDALSILRDSVERLKSFPHDSEAAWDDPQRILAVLLDTAWDYTFLHFVSLERQRRELQTGFN